MEIDLIIFKFDLYEKIRFDTKQIYNEYLDKLEKELCSKRFISERECADKNTETDNVIFKPALQEKIAEWYKFIKTELVDRQIEDDSQSQVMNILREEYCNMFQIDDLLSDIKRRVLVDEMQEKFGCGFSHPIDIEYSIPRVLLYIKRVRFCTNPQYRFYSIKSICEKEKKSSLKVIEDKMNRLFKKIEDSCNDEGIT